VVYLNLAHGLVALPKPLCRKAPILTFDGTLISGMSFEKFGLQFVDFGPIMASGAGKGTIDTF
jgi:hypothetical protein